MTILDFVRMTRHNLWLLIGTILAGLAIAAVWTAFQPAVYSASSTGVVVAGSSGTINDASTGQSLAASRALTYIPLVQTQAVAKRVQTAMGASAPKAIAGHLSAVVVNGTTQIRVSATANDPKQAQALADAALSALADEIQRLETMNDAQVQAANDARKQQASAGSQPGAQPNVDVTPTGSVIKLVPYESAVTPGAPISPNRALNLGMGAVGGIAIGYIIAFIRKGIDQRVRSIGEIEGLTNVGVLGVIPDSPELAEQRQGGDLRNLGAASEAMRQLRTNLRFVAVDKKPRSFVVTSANPGEGKSTVSSNLSRVYADSGVPTLLIDADLRRPMQSRTFGVDSTIGLTQVLAGDIAVEDAIQATDNPNLFILPAGRIPPNPSELVGSLRMAELIKTLTPKFVLIIDAPPLLPVTDAGLLTAEADGAILVLRVNKTYKEQLRLCARILEQVNGTLFGCVLNRAPRKGMGAVLYGYGYGYGGYQNTYYYSADGTKKSRPNSKKGKRGKRKSILPFGGGSGSSRSSSSGSSSSRSGSSRSSSSTSRPSSTGGSTRVPQSPTIEPTYGPSSASVWTPVDGSKS